MLGGIADALSGLWGRTDLAASGRELPPPGGCAHHAPSPRPQRGGLPYTPGQPIARSLPLNAAVAGFVRWMCEMGFIGEYAWFDIWEYYSLWYSAEEKLVPVPVNRKAYFAQELAKLCERGQVRVLQEGRVRRLTTYTILAAEPIRLAGVA
jgi:hypothetical protein